MKKLYRTFFLFTVLLLISVFLTLPTFAATEAAEPQILMFEDGSYIVITIECDQLQDQDGVSGLADRSIKSGTKKYAYYDGSDTLAWEFCVHGTFTYDGLTATATGARHSYNIYDNKCCGKRSKQSPPSYKLHAKIAKSRNFLCWKTIKKVKE